MLSQLNFFQKQKRQHFIYQNFQFHLLPHSYGSFLLLVFPLKLRCWVVHSQPQQQPKTSRQQQQLQCFIHLINYCPHNFVSLGYTLLLYYADVLSFLVFLIAWTSSFLIFVNSIFFFRALNQVAEDFLQGRVVFSEVTKSTYRNFLGLLDFLLHQTELVILLTVLSMHEFFKSFINLTIN